MRIHSAVGTEDPAAGAEPANRERRIKAGYRRLFRAGLDGKRGESKARSLKSKVRCLTRAEGGVRSAEQRRKSHQRRLAAGDYLARFLCAGFAAVLLASVGCVGPRPLEGGKATTIQDRAGVLPAAGGVLGSSPAPRTTRPTCWQARHLPCPGNPFGRAQFRWSATACRCGATRAVSRQQQEKGHNI